MGRNRAVLYHRRVEDTVIIVQPCDRVLVHRRIILRRVGCGFGHRADRRTPRVVETVGVLGRRGLGRNCAAVAGRLAVGHLFCLQRLAVAVYPSDRVLVDSAAVNCFIGCLPSHSYNVRVPALEDICVLSCCCLGGCLAGVSRRHSISNLACLEYSTVVVNKIDRVLVGIPHGVQRHISGGRITAGDAAGRGAASSPTEETIAATGRRG